MPDHFHILIVGTNSRNLELLGNFLSKQGYTFTSTQSKEQINAAIQSEKKIDLALVDITGFDESIWEICQQLHERNVQSLIISPRQSSAIAKESISHGAQGVLVKPLVMHELIDLITKLLES